MQVSRIQGSALTQTISCTEEKCSITNQNPISDIFHCQYIVKRQLKAPWTTKAKEAEGFEGAIPGDNHPSWAELTLVY